MKDESDEDTVAIADDNSLFADAIAARCSAYTTLLEKVAAVDDDALKKEGLLMLGAVRRSFKTHPIAELTSIDGGKGSSA